MIDKPVCILHRDEEQSGSMGMDIIDNNLHTA